MGASTVLAFRALAAGASWAAWVGAVALATVLPGPKACAAEVEVTAQAAADAGLAQPLTAQAGDVVRGRTIVASRQTGLCLLCHRAPIAEVALQGNLSSDLAGAGARWSVAQLRLRIVDAKRLNPETIMPAYHRSQGLRQVSRAFEGKPILEAQQVEDVVAYLSSLK
jgi:L-cysteine S-thiosulfotransferase